MTFRHTPFREILAFQRAHVGSDWYRIQNLADGSTQVMLFDDIGFFGTTASDFISELSGIPGPIDLHLNSQGGEVFEGLAIYSALRQRGGVKVVIDGVAASIASVIAMAASPGQLYVARNGQLMIHDALMAAAGNAADLREMAALLDEQSDNIADIYSQRSGKPASYWREQMRAETWYRGQKAVDAGLADAVLDPPAHGRLLGQDGNHAPMTGTHTHSHSDGRGGDHSHEHSHDGDAAHVDHSHAEPDGDEGVGAVDRADGRVINAVPDSIRSKFVSDLKNDSPTDIAAGMRRLAQWAASGHYPTGCSYADLKWFYDQCAKELKRRNPDSDAGGNFPAPGKGSSGSAPGSAPVILDCHALVAALAALRELAGEKSSDSLDIDLGILRDALKGANA